MVKLFKRKLKINNRLINGYNCVGKFPAHVEFIKMGQCAESLHGYDKLLASCHQARLRLKAMDKPVVIESISFTPQAIELHSLVSSEDKSGRRYPFLFQASSSFSLALELPELSLLAYLPLLESLHQLHKKSPAIDKLNHLVSWFNELALCESQMTRAQMYEQALNCYKSTKLTSLFTLNPSNVSKVDSKALETPCICCWYPTDASMMSLISYLHLMKQSSQGLTGQSLVWRIIDSQIDSVYALESNSLNKLLVNLYNHPSLASSDMVSQLSCQTDLSAPGLLAQASLYDWMNLG